MSTRTVLFESNSDDTKAITKSSSLFDWIGTIVGNFDICQNHQHPLKFIPSCKLTSVTAVSRSDDCDFKMASIIKSNKPAALSAEEKLKTWGMHMKTN
jgi:hypothetical protein